MISFRSGISCAIFLSVSVSLVFHFHFGSQSPRSRSCSNRGVRLYRSSAVCMSEKYRAVEEWPRTSWYLRRAIRRVGARAKRVIAVDWVLSATAKHGVSQGLSWYVACLPGRDRWRRAEVSHSLRDIRSCISTVDTRMRLITTLQIWPSVSIVFSTYVS
jgi:hypothetical protein